MLEFPLNTYSNTKDFVNDYQIKCDLSQKSIKKQKKFVRFWIRFKPIPIYEWKGQFPVYTSYIPWWGWPFELLWRVLYGKDILVSC